MIDADTDEILTLDEVAASLEVGKKTAYSLAEVHLFLRQHYV